MPFILRKLRTFLLQDTVKTKDTGTKRSKIMCFARDPHSSACSLFFFYRASSKADSPSLLRPPKTNASTQNLQTHPPLPRAFLVRNSSLNYREFKTKNWQEHISRHFHSSHLKPIQTTSIIRTRMLSNLFAKRIVIPFCKRELHA